MIQDKKDRSVTIRMNSADYDYLAAVSYVAGMTVSAYLRTLAQATVNAAKTQEKQGALNIADIKALLND